MLICCLKLHPLTQINTPRLVVGMLTDWYQSKPIMKRIALIALLALTSFGVCGDFSCPDGTKPACLENDHKVCPSSAKCVDAGATCFEEYPCDPGGGFVCDFEYDDVLSDYKNAVRLHDELASENIDLRVKRLAQKNCVANASTLKEAKRCVQ